MILLWYDIYTVRQRSYLKKHSEKLFEQFYKDNKSDKVFLFGTGPSINSVMDNDYSNYTTIICNSIVKDNKFLQRIRPNAITFIDSVFHFGVSKYCEQFIVDVKRSKETTSKEVPKQAYHTPDSDKLTQHLKAPVQIRSNTKGAGTITIRFKNEKELGRLTKLLGK